MKNIVRKKMLWFRVQVVFAIKFTNSRELVL